MKKITLTLIVLLGVFTMQGQVFGIKGGVNFSNLTGNAANNFNVLTNFHIGGLYEVDVLEFLSLQPELLYSVQGAKTVDDEIKLNYFTVPVMLKVYLTDRFNIQAGPQFGMLLSESDNFNMYQSKTFDFGFSGGLEFYLSNNFFTQARYFAGTQSVSENYDLKNTGVQVSLGYIFF